jgi:hypothetical protein
MTQVTYSGRVKKSTCSEAKKGGPSIDDASGGFKDAGGNRGISVLECRVNTPE